MKLLAVNICVVLVAAFLAHEASALRCYECHGKECDKVTDDTHVVDRCHPDSTKVGVMMRMLDAKRDGKTDEKTEEKKEDKIDNKKEEKTEEKKEDKKNDKTEEKKEDKTDDKTDEKKDDKKDDKNDDKNDDKKDKTNADEPHCFVREYKDGDKTMFERGWAPNGKVCDQYKDKKGEVKCVQCFDDKCNTAGSLTASILVMLVALAFKTLS